jgi:hypothetical protein
MERREWASKEDSKLVQDRSLVGVPFRYCGKQRQKFDLSD